MASRTRTHRVTEGHSGTNDPLAEAYLHWLVEQVREERAHPAKTYWDLLRFMHTKEFVWLVPNDDNRLGDGLELRDDFFRERNIPLELLDQDRYGPCSMLEVLIALSRRLAFWAEGAPEAWAWQLLANLNLHKLADPWSKRKEKKADQILERLIWRTYSPDGTGGFFPLLRPPQDQRKVELWYQMSAYVSEIHPEY